MSNILDSIKGKIKNKPSKIDHKAPIAWSEYIGIPYYSSSKIKQYEDNPALYMANQLDNGIHNSDADFSKAKSFGSVLHKFLFEPLEFKNNEEYYILSLIHI